MASLKKYWFGMNRENKPECAKAPDSIESTVTLVTQSTNVMSLPEMSADCEQIRKRQCSAKFTSSEATIATKAPTQQVITTDSNEMKASAASSPSFTSESTSQTAPADALQKSTGKSKKGAAKKAAAEKKTAAAEKNGEKKGAAAEKKATKDTTADKKLDEPVTAETTTKAAADEETKIPTADTEEPVVGEESSPKGVTGKPEVVATIEALTTAAAAKAPEKKGKAGGPAEEPVVGEETSPTDKGARKKGKGAKAAKGAAEPKVGEEGSPGRPKKKRKGAADAEEPAVGEEESLGTKERRKRRREGGEEPVGGEEAFPSGGRIRRRRKLEDLTTKEVFIETPSTTVSSLLSPRHRAERRKPFSKPLAFSSRASTLDSLSEFERHESIAHENELQRAWRSVDTRLLKMLPTPMTRPLFLKDPPDLGFEGTLTSELRRDFAKRKIEAMKKPSLELIRDPLMLRFIQPRMNKCEILRKKHIKKETIMSAYFEQHYDRFQKPPFKTIRLMRKCV